MAWLAVFLVTAGTIALRNQASFESRQRLVALGDSLEAVERLHGQLSADLATLLAPAELRPLAEELGLRAPSDSESVGIRVVER